MSIWQLVVRNGTSSHEIPITIVQNDTESYWELLNGISCIILLNRYDKKVRQLSRLISRRGTVKIKRNLFRLHKLTNWWFPRVRIRPLKNLVGFPLAEIEIATAT